MNDKSTNKRERRLIVALRDGESNKSNNKPQLTWERLDLFSKNSHTVSI